MSTSCNKSDSLSHDELRSVSSAQIEQNILHRTSSSRQLRQGKKEMIITPLEDDLYF